MGLTSCTHESSCTHQDSSNYQFLGKNLKNFPPNLMYKHFLIFNLVAKQVKVNKLNNLGSTRIPNAPYYVSGSLFDWFWRRRVF